MNSLDKWSDAAIQSLLEEDAEVKPLPCGRWNMHPPHEWTSQFTKKTYECKGDALLHGDD